MSTEEYWEMDPWLTAYYREAYDLRTKMRNHDAWWQGFYIHEAVAAAIAPLVKGKFKYPRTPHELDIPEEKNEEAALREREKAKAFFNLKLKALEQRYGKRR